jgi:uncharacterized protein (TIGR02145 family)
MKILTLYTLCIIALILQSCGDSTSPTSDANQTVNIGSQVWTSNNLDVSTYRNGDPIRYASTPAEWLDATIKEEGAWCYYNNDPKNGEIYGKLYNWYAVNDPRVLAPLGYHIPSDSEWTVLTEYLGENNAGLKMKSSTGWTDGGNGDNSSGFNGLPSGYCNNNGSFFIIAEYGTFWSSSENYANLAWYRDLDNSNSKVGRYYVNKNNGLSVRCLRD